MRGFDLGKYGGCHISFKLIPSSDLIIVSVVVELWCRVAFVAVSLFIACPAVDSSDFIACCSVLSRNVDLTRSVLTVSYILFQL